MCGGVSRIFGMDKRKQLLDAKIRRYRIYGIYDFVRNKLIRVSLDLETILFDYDIEDYDEERYDVVSFDVILG